MLSALKKHWAEYLMEAAELALFMVSASIFTIILFYPGSPVAGAIPSQFIRRILMGLAMGFTLIAIVYSPWGKRSGAHMNPAFTLMFFRLGKVAPFDAFFYILAQFAGGITGIGVVSLFAGKLLAHPSVNYAATLPGPKGIWPAFAGEAIISFLLCALVLVSSNHKKIAQFTGLFCGIAVALFITIECPLSGMSMNPARSLGSAFLPQLWKSLWIYFVAPPLGMVLAAEIFPVVKRAVTCAKLHHQNRYRCIFCEYHTAKDSIPVSTHVKTSLSMHA
jgi:aquaporin Z